LVAGSVVGAGVFRAASLRYGRAPSLNTGLWSFFALFMRRGRNVLHSALRCAN
jgi:hypothetical protein